MQKILFLICVCIGVMGAAHGDTETLTWYVGNDLYDTTTCTIGGDINLPTAPTKRGYTFAGWMSGIYDMSTLNTSTNGTAYYHRSGNTCKMNNSTVYSCTDGIFAHMANGDWSVVFSYGAVYGTSRCSDTANEASSGASCWCRVTGFIPDGEDFIYEPAVSLWAFRYTLGSASGCASDCPSHCGTGVRDNSSRRAGLYGS